MNILQQAEQAWIEHAARPEVKKSLSVLFPEMSKIEVECFRSTWVIGWIRAHIDEAPAPSPLVNERLKVVILNKNSPSRPSLNVVDLMPKTPLETITAVVRQFHSDAWTDYNYNDLRFFIGSEALVAFVPNYFQS